MSASRPVSALSALSSSSVEDMPRTRAKTAPKKPTTRKRMTTATTIKKTVSRTATTKAKAATKKISKPASRPTWKDIIRECIADNKDDSRVGVSRATIKKVCLFY